MNETFEQVLGYMTAHESGNAEEAFFDREAWRELIARLRAAHEREMDELNLKHERSYHALEVHCKKLEDEYLIATNALKPVLECREEACRAFGDHYLMLDNAVREAQRIAKEGGVE